MRRTLPRVASIHCASADLARPTRARGPRRRPARHGGRGGRRAPDLDDRQRPRRAAVDPAGVPPARPALLRLRRLRQRDLAVRAREQPADHAGPGAPARHRRVPRRRGQGVLPPRRRQRPQPRAGHAVELRVRLAAAGRLDDHDAGRQERLPRRPRARRPLQAAAGPLRPDARARVHQGRDPRALPEHRLLRQQRLRHPGGRRDLLRQDRRPAHLHPGRVPRRPRAGAVGVRPGQQPRAQPGPLRPGARPPRRRPRTSPQAEATDLETNFVLPDRVRTIPERTNIRTYYTEALRDYLLNRSDVLGATYEERYNKLFRGGLRIHTTFNPINQAQAESARNVLPDTAQGFDAAIVSLDTQTGAIRAMVGGRGFVPGEREVNMALQPRQTGSSIKFFVLAAALQAGAQPDDIIDGQNVCSFAVPDAEPFVIKDAVSRAPDTLAAMTWCSINCAYVRLAQIVGLNRMVDTVYRMAQSLVPLPGPAGRATARRRRARAVRQLLDRRQRDVADRHGVRRPDDRQRRPAPRAVLRRLDRHRRRAAHLHPRRRRHPGARPGRRPRRRRHAEGRADLGTGRRYPLDGGRPAAGKTGTQADNTNAWFVGFTPQLTTAVWVGDPNGYTPMVGVPEFGGANASRVQGGLYPTQIWKTYMDQALAGQPFEDWAPPPPDARPPARLYLPGNECLARAVSTRRRGPRHRAAGRGAAGRGAAGRSGRLRQPGPGAARRPPRPPSAAAAPPRRRAAPPTGTDAGPRHADHRAAGHAPRADRGRHDRAARPPRPARPDAVDAADEPSPAADAAPSRLDGRPHRRVGSAVLPCAPYRGAVLTDDLLELQRLDTTADQLAHRRAHLPERTAAQQRGRRARRPPPPPRRRRRADRGAGAGHRRARARRRAARRPAHHASRRQLKTVIAPREAEALMHELATLAERRDALDDQELASLEEQSTLADDDRRAGRRAARARDGRGRRGRRAGRSPRPRSTPSWPAARRPRAELAGAARRRRARSLRAAAGPLRRRRRGPPRRAAAAAGATSTCRPPRSTRCGRTPAGEFADCPQCGRLLVP